MVTFRSPKFPPYDGEEESINPGLWGKRLAEHLVDQLAGIEVETEELGRVVTALESILSAAPDITDVAWSTGGSRG